MFHGDNNMIDRLRMKVYVDYLRSYAKVRTKALL